MFSSFPLTKLKENQAFGIIEALMAMTIMSLVLVALLGLLSVSVKAIATSKNSTLATQLANEYIERIRAMSYDQVGIVDGDPSGILKEETTRTVSGIEFTINYEVIWVDDSVDGTAGADVDGTQDYKQVSISVHWSEKGATKTVSAVTYVRYKSSQSEPPTVNFIHGDVDPDKTPTDGTIFGLDDSPYKSWFDSGTIPLKASGTDPENDLVLMRFYVGGQTPGDGLYKFDPVGSYENNPVCFWDPTTLDSFGAPVWGEGTHEVVVEVWDSHGLRDAKSIFWTIDKYSPRWIDSEPASLAVEALHGTSAKLTWQAAWDGSDKVERYKVYRGTGGSFTEIEGDLNAPTCDYIDTGLTLSPELPDWPEWTEKYQYYITALSVGGRESTMTSNTATVKVMFDIYEDAKGKDSGKRWIRVGWNSPPAGITVIHYDIYRDNVIDGQIADSARINTSPISGASTFFLDNNNGSGLPKGTYEYRVTAYSSADDSSIVNKSVIEAYTTVN